MGDIVNLFAYLATDSTQMKSQSDPESSKNNQTIRYISSKVKHLLLALVNGHKSRAQEVLSLLSDKLLYCIKKNKGRGFLHASRIKPKDYLRPMRI
ncbi:MAG: hypothetical protein ACJAZP_003447 [Psychromonas sp.]